MTAPSPARRRQQRGSAIVESALTLLAFLLLVFGIMEFGRVMYAYNWTSYVAREATRWASVRGAASGRVADENAVRNFVRSRAIALDRNDLQVATTWTPNKNPGSTVNVTITYTISPMLNAILDHDLRVRSSSSVVIMR